MQSKNLQRRQLPAAPGDAARATDPVCGMNVAPQKAAGQVEYSGRTYYFCSPRCAERFTLEPEKFLAAAGLSAKSANPAGAPGGAPAANVRYTCPMHPEIIQIGPGSCPKCGMALEPMDFVAGDESDPEYNSMRLRFWVSTALAIPIVLLAMGGELLGLHLEPSVRNGIEFLLATPAVLWGGWPFFERFWSSLVNRSPNMFTLIGLGTGTAYAESVAATLFPQIFPESFRGMHGAAPVYFESAAVITALVLLGQVLELRARQKTSGAIRALLNLAPAQAHLIAADGSERDIAVDQVQRGNRLRILPGARIAVDGIVLEGESAVDESMVSGESIPVEKSKGDPVTGGTLNTNGSLIMEAQRVGADSTLARIVKLVSAAQRSRAPMQRLADEVAAYFVPAVVIASALTFAGWALLGPQPRLAYALVNAVSVLIIACPCALGLATPMSIMVAVGRGAHAGVLVRNAEALETFARVDTLVVDKTGTLTEGKPEVAAVRSAGKENFSEEDVLRLAASLEQASEHPLARGIVRAAQAKGMALAPVAGFLAAPGGGAQGTVSDSRVLVGTMNYLRQRPVQGLPPEDGPNPFAGMDQLASPSIVFVAVNEQLVGAIALSDKLKDSAADAIKELQNQGLRIVMLSGDRQAVAEFVAKQLAIDEVRADVAPEKKAETINELRRAGRIVAMAGDGVNDAPALAAANVGIAMGTGSDVSLESAGMVLLAGDLRGLVRAQKLSRATVKNIRQNLAFAFLYNIVGIPVAAGILYPHFGLLLSPMIASAAMSFSSVSVIANALRLRRTQL
ncbi:MAG TPA: heavy metal translocating P-type ATPase [Candidatus Saccharimonadales bacterium]|nr:heavy metal translocating P-type ATPase [Candidatus Saccharimonadales bacterium]